VTAPAIGWQIRSVRRPDGLDPVVLHAAADLLRDLVRGGAALGWVDPPPPEEVGGLLLDVAQACAHGDGALVVAQDDDGRLLGLGYWLRYARPTHRPHVDVEKIAVAPDQQGRGIGRGLLAALVEEALSAGIEQLTLDARGDNVAALHLYESLGFVEYGRLPGFVAVGDQRYDKTFWVLRLR